MNKQEKTPILKTIFNFFKPKTPKVGPSSFELEAAKTLKDLEKSYKK